MIIYVGLYCLDSSLSFISVMFFPNSWWLSGNLQINIDPESLKPKLPSKKDLRPYPRTCYLEFKGHSGPVRSLSVEATGQWIASGIECWYVSMFFLNTYVDNVLMIQMVINSLLFVNLLWTLMFLLLSLRFIWWNNSCLGGWNWSLS
jgi:hypothetical protein